MAKRNICVTAADGQTGFVIAELLLTNKNFSNKFESVTALTLHPTSAKAKELGQLGANVVPHKAGREREMVNTLKQTGCDTICLIPPAHRDKYDITVELINAAKKAGVQNVCFISSAGCDLAERDQQPRMREFIDLESLVMAAKGDPKSKLGHSPVIIRGGFYAENLLIYSHQAQKEGILPLPIGENHKLSPVAVGDVAQLAAHVLVGKGKHGFDDRHRGQLMVCTGPAMMAGPELATAASKALGADLKFEDISEAEAKKVLHRQHESDDSEKQYLLEYYALVRQGKTNYISTSAFHYVTNGKPQEPDEFFQAYAEAFTPKETSHANKKLRTK